MREILTEKWKYLTTCKTSDFWILLTPKRSSYDDNNMWSKDFSIVIKTVMIYTCEKILLKYSWSSNNVIFLFSLNDILIDSRIIYKKTNESSFSSKCLIIAIEKHALLLLAFTRYFRVFKFLQTQLIQLSDISFIQWTILYHSDLYCLNHLTNNVKRTTNLSSKKNWAPDLL